MKRRVMMLIISLASILLLFPISVFAAEKNHIEVNGFQFDIPDSFLLDEDSDISNGVYRYRIGDDAFLYFDFYDDFSKEKAYDTLVSTRNDQVESGIIVYPIKSFEINGCPAYSYQYRSSSTDTQVMVETIINDNYAVLIQFLKGPACEIDAFDFYDMVEFANIENVSTISSDSDQSTDSGKDTESPESSQELTMGQENAIKKATSFINIMPFSRTGLIEQLEYDGFSTEDATFAVDSLDVDWNEQAAKKAQSFLDIMAFSRDGLIEQLEYNGFTPEQAEYGVSAVGY